MPGETNMGQSLILNQQKYEESESNSKRMHKYSECFQNSFKRYLPITGWLPNYTLSNLQCDFVAGVTVGLMVIPQGLAYASLAGLQTQYGLYSAFMGCFVYCVFGSAKDVTLGPTAILSLMVAIYGNPSQPEFTVAFTFFVGIILLAMGILRLGFLVKFISVPVISAFTSAAAITIAVSQLKDILGLHNIPRDFIPSIITTFRSLEHINYWDIIFGLGCIILLVLLKQLSKIKWREDENYQLPLIQRCARKFLWLVGIGRNAVVVLVSLLLAYCFVEQGKNIFTLSDDIDFTLPPFEPPEFTLHLEIQGKNNKTTPKVVTVMDMLESFNTGLAVVPLLAFMEAIAIGKAFSRRNDYKIEPTQELIALGIANILSSFVSSYPITGSFSRTAVNSQSGVRTPAGGLFTGTIVILSIKYLTPYFQYIPRACLGAVIITAVLQMVDYKIVKKIWKINKIDLIPLFCTFFACFYTLEFGLIIGISISLIFVLYPQVYPVLKQDIREMTIIKVDNGVLYLGIEHITSQIENLVKSPDPPIMIVLDLSGLTHIDYTVVNELTQILEETKKANTELYFTNLRLHIREVLIQANLGQYMSTARCSVDKSEEGMPLL